MTGRALSTLAGHGPDAERWIFWYMALTPLWWVTGTIVPIGIAGLVWLYVARPRTDAAVTTVSWLWFSIAVAQYLSSVINWSFGNETDGDLAHSFVSLSSTGWILIGMCFGVGCSYRLAAPRLVRAVCLQALWILVFAALGYAVFVIGGNSHLEVPSLLAVAVPSLGDPGKANFVMRFFLKEDFMGDPAFRLVLFFPWSTGLALAGLLILLLAFCERAAVWRLVALAGGVTGLVLSYSRAVFAASIVAGAVIVALRSRIRTKLWFVIGAGTLTDLALLMGLGPESGVSDLYRAFTHARAGSSEARDELYRAAWRGFTQSPWIGHGWFGQTYARWMPINIGSHSAFYGVLYLGGLMTFTVVCLAYGATLWLCLSRLQSGGRALPQAFAMLLVYGITSYGENMQTLVPSLLASFVWIGGEMATTMSETGEGEFSFQTERQAPLAPALRAAPEHVALRVPGTGAT